MTTSNAQLGELPTSGGLRPGPIGLVPAKPTVVWHGARPVAIRIPIIQVDSDIELATIDNGILQDLTGPWVVARYEESARLGILGNAVFSGHLDYWGTGPAVFYQLGDLVAGNRIEITGNNGQVFRYNVAWTKLYDAAAAPIAEIVGPSKDQAITLINCGGTFNNSTQEYDQRTVVRAIAEVKN
jgi:sortase A